MKAARTPSGITLKILSVIITVLLTSSFLSAQNWYNADWSYRSAVSVPGLTADQTDFQVKISLNSTFDFLNTLDDGSDIRITAADGTTELPFWIEEWNKAGTTGTIWVKVPLLPVAGLTIYLYYGNPTPVIILGPGVETPPAGPYTKDPLNPIIPIGVPAGATSLLAENIVYDDVTGHYWMVLTDQTGGSRIALVYSDTPTDPASWYWGGYVAVGSAIAPHIMKHEGTWYIFYGDRAHRSSTNPAGWPIAVASSSSVNGPYTYLQEILASGPAGSWESYRVDEPCVFWSASMNKWILIYMAETGLTDEQVGYATADNLLGPYTRYAGNPCIPFGPVGSIDRGTVADPWVYEYQGTYYIGYTVSPTRSSPWQTALATTTDWLTFTKHGMLLARGTEFNSFRGAVTRINDEYVFAYTGGPAAGQYRLCIATQPVYQSPPSHVNDGYAVFDFFDGFDGTGIDQSKWTFASGTSAQTAVANGLLTLTATTTFVKIDGTTPFGMNFIGETRARHPNQGTVNMIGEYGFCAGTAWTSNIRIVDDFPSITNWQRQASPDEVINMPQTADQNWHILRLYRESPGTAGFQIDNNPAVIDNTNITTDNLPPFLMSYGNTNQFVADWTRIRKWAGADPVAAVAAAQFLGSQWNGGAAGDPLSWNNAANWTPGIPTATDNVTIPGNASYFPRIGGTLAECNNLLIQPSASLTISPSGDLTVHNGMINNGTFIIQSTSTSNGGSLIVHGTSTGNVTYNRYLRPDDNPEEPDEDRHFFSSPVGGLNVMDFFTVNNLRIGRDGSVYQLWSYQETDNTWPFVTSGTFESGRGYNLYQAPLSTGLMTFTGSVVSTATFTATSPYATGYTDRVTVADYNEEAEWAPDRSWTDYGGGGWNLMGNPFTSAMNAGAFIGGNSGKFDPHYQALYVYDGINDRYLWVAASTPGYPQEGEFSGGQVQSGQGFFVLALYNGIEFDFNSQMQVHGSSTLYLLKSAVTEDPWPGLQLKVRFGEKESSTLVVFNENMTAGLDPGYDVGQLSSSPDVEIYTSLVQKDNNVNFARQALSLNSIDKEIISVGIDSEKGGEITFSAFTVPFGNYRFWLEDRVTGLFTDLSTKSYTVTIPSNTYGTGRFFILASTNTPTSIDKPFTEDAGVRVWTSDGKVVIKGEVSDRAVCEVYNLSGQKVLESRLTDGSLNLITLPQDLNGVYLVRVTDGVKVTMRKVALLLK